MAIQKNNVSNALVNLNNSDTIERVARMTSTWFATSSIFDDCDTKYVNESATLEDNMIGEAILAGKRGGANRLRVYVNKRNDVLAISIRYGNNMPYHSEVLQASKALTQRIEDVAQDGKTESRIQFSATRFGEFLRVVETIANADSNNDSEELKKASDVVEVTA